MSRIARPGRYCNVATLPSATRTYPLLCSSLSSHHIQSIIVEGEGIPLPSDFEEVMDAMFTWGRSFSAAWYYRTLALMLFFLSMPDLNRNFLNRKKLFFDIIQSQVVRITSRNVAAGTGDRAAIVADWAFHFDAGGKET